MSIPVRQYATLSDLDLVQADGYAKNYSTAAELYDRNGLARPYLDAGQSGSLVLNEAVEFGIHPYIEIFDVVIDKQGDLIGIETMGGTKWVTPDTVIAWM